MSNLTKLLKSLNGKTVVLGSTRYPGFYIDANIDVPGVTNSKWARVTYCASDPLAVGSNLWCQLKLHYLHGHIVCFESTQYSGYFLKMDDQAKTDVPETDGIKRNRIFFTKGDTNQDWAKFTIVSSDNSLSGISIKSNRSGFTGYYLDANDGTAPDPGDHVARHFLVGTKPNTPPKDRGSWGVFDIIPQHASGVGSDLSKNNSYDMVVAVTQKAVNDGLIDYLNGYQGTVIKRVYVYDTSSEKIVTAQNVDPFSITTASRNIDLGDLQSDYPQIYNLHKQHHFKFAFKAKIGLPPFPNDDDEGTQFTAFVKKFPVVSFNSEGDVTYNMFFSEFQIISLNLNPDAGENGQWEWKNTPQPADTPYVVSFKVDLNTKTYRDLNDQNRIKDLPASVKNIIHNVGYSMFSLKQLYVDLNNAQSLGTSHIEDIAPNSKIALFLKEHFLVDYINQLKGENGFIMGAAVNYIGNNLIPQSSTVPNPSVIPSDFNFQIQAYKDNGTVCLSDDCLPAYTLNYLITTGTKKLPASLTKPTWNWVDKNELLQMSGIMAVNKKSFMTYLKTTLDQTLGEITKNLQLTDIDFTSDDLGLKTIDAIPSTKYEPSGNDNEIFTFNYASNIVSKTHTGGDTVPVIMALKNVQYKVSSSVSILNGTNCQLVLTTKMELNITFDYIFQNNTYKIFNIEGDCGNWVEQTFTTTYILNIDDKGQITSSKMPSVIVDNPHYPPIKPNFPVDPHEAHGFIDVKKRVNYFNTHFKGIFTSFEINQANKLQKLLNNINPWVFPGGQTFAFKNVGFSVKKDFTTELKYLSAD